MRGNGGFTETDVGHLLSRLREQDRRNQRNLDELRQQLHGVTGVKPLSPRNTLAAEIRFVPVYSNNDDPPPSPPPHCDCDLT